MLFADTKISPSYDKSITLKNVSYSMHSCWGDEVIKCYHCWIFTQVQMWLFRHCGLSWDAWWLLSTHLLDIDCVSVFTDIWHLFAKCCSDHFKSLFIGCCCQFLHCNFLSLFDEEVFPAAFAKNPANQHWFFVLFFFLGCFVLCKRKIVCSSMLGVEDHFFYCSDREKISQYFLLVSVQDILQRY